MNKIRVYELGRTLNIDSKTLVNRIKALGIDITGHQSTLSSAEVEKIKADVLGPTTGQAGPKKVILRRKKTDEEGDKKPFSSDGEEPTPAAEEITSTTEHADKSPSKEFVATAPEAEEIASKPQTEETETESSHEVAEAISDKEPPPIAAQQGTTQIATPETGKTQQELIHEMREKKREKLMQGGATIVRKADPQPVTTKPAGDQSSGYDARGNKIPGKTFSREDSRGTRLTGKGFGTTPTLPIEEFVPDLSAAALEKRREKAKKTIVEEVEDDKNIKPKVPLKGKRQNINLRALLAEEVEEEHGEDVEEEKTVKKTVYTPTTYQRKDLKRRKDLKATSITTPRAAYRVVRMEQDVISIKDLAHQLSVKAADIIKKLMAQGIMATINLNLDIDTATLLASEYGYEIKSFKKTDEDILKVKTFGEYETSQITSRPPIVTVMGHVDHGKTSILDAIRQTAVASREAGGITQHIGAYTVDRDGKRIAFLDTPGHEAFSQMRARGAKLTDIVVLVVAADDGVMPQTIEAIAHAKAAGVPLIVAINKVDKPNVNFDRINTELANQGVLSEEWGGETQFIKVSALKRIGLEELLDAILLQSEVLELKCVLNAPAEGTVVEAHLDKGRGPVATVMVQNGSLSIGDFIIAGHRSGRVRGMFDHTGSPIKVAGPSTPVEIIGLDDVPVAGDTVNCVADEKIAKEVLESRLTKISEVGSKSVAATLDDLLGKIKTQDSIEVPLIVKADTHGSVEAICESLTKLNSNDKNVITRIIHKGVGGITASDLALAHTAKAIVIGFNVRAPRILEEQGEKLGTLIKYFSIIYEVVDAVKAIMAGALPPIKHEEILGHAEVRNCISVPKIGVIAGSAVIDGKITRNAQLRVIRDDVIVFNGKVKSLRRFKDDVREVQQGYECGIGVENYNDLRIGDKIEAYVVQETPATLEIQQ